MGKEVDEFQVCFDPRLIEGPRPTKLIFPDYDGKEMIVIDLVKKEIKIDGDLEAAAQLFWDRVRELITGTEILRKEVNNA